MLCVPEIPPRVCKFKASPLTKQEYYVEYSKAMTHSYDKILNVTILGALSRFFPLVSLKHFLETKTSRAPIK